ncbi:hypothetical protein J7E62_00050 [Variovorax paradoxus]|nr:hypothetical protein [Variovorax paradoxus]
MSTRKPAVKSHAVSTTEDVHANLEASFAEVVRLIERARQRAYQAVNTELVASDNYLERSTTTIVSG